MKNDKFNIISTFINYVFLFFLGGIIYYILEIIFRGHSHYSMFVAGGASVLSINILCFKVKRFKKSNLFLKALIGGTIITFIEFIIGIIFNIILKENIWDYTSLPLNLLGQICLPFSLLWVLLSFPTLLVCKIFNSKIFYINNKRKRNSNGHN